MILNLGCGADQWSPNLMEWTQDPLEMFVKHADDWPQPLLFSCWAGDSLNPTDCSQASLSFTIFRSLLKLISVESVMPSNHLILFRPLLLLFSVFPSIRAFFNELVLCTRWPKNWSFDFSISPVTLTLINCCSACPARGRNTRLTRGWSLDRPHLGNRGAGPTNGLQGVHDPLEGSETCVC